MTYNKESCTTCNKVYISWYSFTEDQPKNCPYCGGSHIRLLQQDMDYIPLHETAAVNWYIQCFTENRSH